MENKFDKYIDFYKSIIDQDRNEVVICNLENEIIYMNPEAVKNYAKWGGEKLIGRDLMACHNPESQEKMRRVLEWFAASEDHNIVHSHYSVKRNTDVYIIALRKEGKLIGYYEKHECRNKETMELYDLR